MGLIETTEPLEGVTADQHAGTGNGHDITLCQRESEIAWVIFCGVTKRMPPNSIA